MVGLGESSAEIREALLDLRSAGCDVVTLGQYLQPTRGPRDVERFYYSPDEFEALAKLARSLGFPGVASGPFVRSSYQRGGGVQRGPAQRCETPMDGIAIGTTSDTSGKPSTGFRCMRDARATRNNPSAFDRFQELKPLSITEIRDRRREDRRLVRPRSPPLHPLPAPGALGSRRDSASGDRPSLGHPHRCVILEADDLGTGICLQ